MHANDSIVKLPPFQSYGFFKTLAKDELTHVQGKRKRAAAFIHALQCLAVQLVQALGYWKEKIVNLIKVADGLPITNTMQMLDNWM